MVRIFLLSMHVMLTFINVSGQTNPVITSWLQNTTLTGSYYVAGNSNPINNGILVNCQAVQYNSTWVYISTKGIPSYPTGPFLDGNPSQATNQNAIFRYPLVPTQNTGTPTATTGGNIGVFINGVALFDYRDGVSWHHATNSLRGGPLGGAGDGVWNRDAVVAELSGFDCSKGHPAMGNYHHHQNPSAYDMDLVVISTICNLYDAEGLYAINPSEHSPLLGYAYDGFPIYGAYGFANSDGSGGPERIKSSYQLRNIAVRTHYADGTDVTDGPTVSVTYPLGYFREDYEYIYHAGEDYLDEHNGRLCVTPEYPDGIYAYFCTVNANHNSAYPYAIGPTFYGVKNASKVASIPGGTTVYQGPLPIELVNLTCFMKDGKACLQWQTASEANNSHFVIEKSSDNMNFLAIGEVKGAGTSNVLNDYEFFDVNPNANTSYYRLKQVDFNGQFEYSKVVALINSERSKFKVFFSGQANIIIVQKQGLANTNCNVVLYDSNGRKISQNKILQGSTLCYIDAQTVYDGMYVIAIETQGTIESQKIIVQH